MDAEEKIRFTSSILPKWARRTKSLDALLPVLYLRGVSTGDFQEVLAALLGKDAPNLSPAVITRLTANGRHYDAWQKRRRDRYPQKKTADNGQTTRAFARFATLNVRKLVLDLSDTVRRTCTVITGAW